MLHALVSAFLVLVRIRLVLYTHCDSSQITLLVLAPLFKNLPQAALSSIIIMALTGLRKRAVLRLHAFLGLFLQFLDAWAYWKIKTTDFIIWAGTFLGTVVLNVSLGLSIPCHSYISHSFRPCLCCCLVRHCPAFQERAAILHDPCSCLSIFASFSYFNMVPGQISGTELYRDTRRVKNPKVLRHISIFRFHASLNFANLDYFQV
jgi:MFS superfamily sulfate permease-like transporter